MIPAMSSDRVKLVFTYAIAAFLILGTYYALVLYPYQLEQDVKLWLTGVSGGAVAFVFGDQIASRTRHDQHEAFNAGLGATPNDQP